MGTFIPIKTICVGLEEGGEEYVVDNKKHNKLEEKVEGTHGWMCLWRS